MLEFKIERDINKYLLSLGAYILKGDTSKNIGTPDIIACINGYFVAIEVKQPTKTPRINQINQLSIIRKSKGIAFYATSTNQVKSTLKELKII